MLAWLLSYVRFQPVSLPQEMKAAYWSGPQTAKVLYAKPERDEMKPGSTHLWSDNDLIAEEIAREQAGCKVQPFRARK